MSATIELRPWYDRYWQPLVVLFALIWIGILLFYNPTS